MSGDGRGHDGERRSLVGVGPWRVTRRLAVALWLVGLLGASALIYAQHEKARERGAERNDRYALLLMHDVWNLDRENAARTVQLIADSEQYALVSVVLSDGTPFARFPVKDVAPSGLWSAGDDRFVTPIRHEGEVIATLETREENPRLFYYALQLGVLVMFGVLVQVVLQNAAHRRDLARLRLHGEITLREEMEARLAEREGELKRAQRLEALGQVAGGVAHDFNNLLTVIIGRVQLAQKLASETVVVHLEAALEAAERAQVMTQQLLSFGRGHKLKQQDVDLSEVVSGMRAMLRHLLPSRIALETELGVELPKVRADAGQLEQVILNLVVNARDAIASAGSVRVMTARAEREGRPVVTLAIRDTGAGMTREVQRQVFAPFFTTKLVGQGTGLGLSTVKRIVEQSGGALELDSEVGRGTTVTVVFPERPDEAREPSPLAEFARKARVLVVEDDPGVRLFVRDALTSFGLEVATARDAEDALRLLELSPTTDLVVAELDMPGMGGLTLRKRARDSDVDTPFVFISARGQGGLGLEREIVLTKPFTAPELCSAVQWGLEREGTGGVSLVSGLRRRKHASAP